MLCKTVHVSNLNAACVLSSLSLNSADESFLPSSPPKTFNHHKVGGGESPFAYLSPSVSPSFKHPPLCLLWNNGSESPPACPSSPFLSLRWRSRTMWSRPIATAQRRLASSCVKQRDSWTTDWPKVGANIWFHFGGAIGGEILSQTGLVLLMIRHNLVSFKHGSWWRLPIFFNATQSSQ